MRLDCRSLISLYPMIYQTHRPKPPLDEFVDWFWFYADLQVPHQAERVLPDGTFELIIDLRETPRKLFLRDDGSAYREFRGAWISGTRSNYIVIDVLQNASMIGVHFKPGGAAAFMSVPAEELTNQVEHAEEIWGNSVRELREALLSVQTIPARFALLERFLLDRLHQPEATDLVGYALRRMADCPEESRVAEVAREIGLSQKHFISIFRERVGLTPKRFCRVRRFHKALQEIESKAALEWADIACATGYYDQSHFIHDFHAFSGMNPSAYLTQRGEYLGFVPINE